MEENSWLMLKKKRDYLRLNAGPFLNNWWRVFKFAMRKVLYTET